MALGLAEYERADVAQDPPPPVGLIIAVTFGAMIAGAAGSMLLHRQSVAAAWVVAAMIGAALAVATRTLFNGSFVRLSLLLCFGLATGMFAYLLVLGGESIPRTRSASLLLAMLLLDFLAACLIPVAIILAAAGRRLSFTRELFIPSLIKAALGAAAVILSFVAVLGTMAATIGWSDVARFTAVVTVPVGLPLLLAVPWAWAYSHLISRWAVARPPQLSHALDVLFSRTGFRFDRIACMPAWYGGGVVCEVIQRLRGSTLAISESIATDLEREELVALLAHEAAHVQQHHARRKLLFFACGSLAVIGVTVAVPMLISASLPDRLGFVRILPMVLGATFLSQLYNAWVIRRHEREADAAAVAVSGAEAFCNALEYLGKGTPEAAVHIRWTTHGTREERIARIRAMERSA